MGELSVAGLSGSGIDRELLETAVERGYFEIPREVSVGELATELDLSEQEAKRRLAQGLSVILQEYRGGDSTKGLLTDPTTRAV